MTERLYVAHLSRTTSVWDLKRLFATIGTVRGAQVLPYGARGGGTVTGLVEMDSEKEADAAIAALDGRPYRGYLLAVGWATPRQAGGADGPRMFDSMNIPDEAECDEYRIPDPGGFGGADGPFSVP